MVARHGNSQVRQRASHIAIQKRTADTAVSLPAPGHPTIPTGALLSIIRQAGLPGPLLRR
ncbi:MAG: type II toxin-antitoxin system HicA family toxin [Chthonomonadales bacterium]|nr:type II toxin-antitoxin system HicA family toxin [Chthonomonadales bacterium]